MRHGLIRWDESELATSDVEARQDALRDRMAQAGLDALVVYCNHVRSAGVTWATGFTPYWSDALWLLPREGRPFFAAALTPRVGNWIAATNPTSDLAHSPRPGELVGEHLTKLGLTRVGIVELDRLPGGLLAEIEATSSARFEDATALFQDAQTAPSPATARLLSRAADLARRVFEAVPAEAAEAGDLTGPAELAARLGGAEEVYVAVAPDLARGSRLARVKGTTPVGPRHALRLTLARHGCWLRMTRTFAADDEAARLVEVTRWFDELCTTLPGGPGLDRALAAAQLPDGLAMDDWQLEAPRGTLPLAIVAKRGTDPAGPVAGASLTLRLRGAHGPVLLAGPLTGRVL